MTWWHSTPVLTALLIATACSAQIADDSESSLGHHVIVREIGVIGNNKTKQQIILRELPFGEHDTLAAKDMPKLINACVQNLLNTGLFNFVTVTELPINAQFTDILINVVERWYIWPFPEITIADPNFNTWWETKDLSRLNYGGYIFHQNFRGRNERLFLRVNVGYSDQYGISYRAPFINRKRTLGIGLGYKYQENIETAYGTSGNKRLLFRPDEGQARKEHYGFAEVNLRRKIYSKHTLRSDFHRATVPDTLAQIAKDYFWGQDAATRFFSLEYQFTYDKRDLKTYPLNGYAVGVSARKDGLGLYSSGTLSQSSIKITGKLYHHLGGRFYWAGGLTGKYSPNTRYSYYTQTGLGYNNFVRGYELYVIDGNNYLLFKSNAKFQLIKPKKGDLPVIGAPQFKKYHYSMYLNVFFDQGYVGDFQYLAANPLVRKSLTGFGVGIDFVTYYDKVLRFELATNHLKETGLFIHFTHPI